MNTKTLTKLLVIGIVLTITGTGIWNYYSGTIHNGDYGSDSVPFGDEIDVTEGYSGEGITVKPLLDTEINISDNYSSDTKSITESRTLSVEEPNISVSYVKFTNNNAQMRIDMEHMIPDDYIYVENYYQADSSGGPKFYSSNRYEIKSDGDVSFDLYRPSDRFGQTYFMVETIILRNKTIYIHWWTDLRKYWN